MVLEINQVVIDGEENTFSMVAPSGKLTCLTGGTAERRRRWLLTLLGFVPVRQGYVCIDGEPLEEQSLAAFRSLMAYAPAELLTEGEVLRYEPPSIQDVFNLRANRHLAVSNGILAEEMRNTGCDMARYDVRLLAVAHLLQREMLLVSGPPPDSADYLHRLAASGKVVVTESDSPTFLERCDQIVELN